MCKPKITLTLKNPKLIDTTCEESLEYFEDEKSLKEMLVVYEKQFTPKKKWVACVVINTRQEDGETKYIEIDKDNEEYNLEFLKENVLPLGDTIDILMDINNEEKVIKVGKFLDKDEQEDHATSRISLNLCLDLFEYTEN